MPSGSMTDLSNSPSSPAEQEYDKLKELYERLVGDAEADGRGPETLPAWYAHLPSGRLFRIKRISTFGPFIRFIAPDDKTVVLIAPESVAVTVAPIPPESDEPRFPLGFAAPEATDETD